MIRRLTAREHLLLGLHFLLIILAAGLSFGCSGNSDAKTSRGGDRAVPAVEAVQARYGSLPLSERFSGVVKAQNQVELYPQISAPVTKVYVNNGDLVTAGSPLVQLRDTEFREQLKQAEADYQIAVAQAKQADAELKRVNEELRRNTSLSEKNLISTTEFEKIQTQAIAAEADADLSHAKVNQAQAMVDQRKEELSRTIIRAPVDGSVGNRNAEIGMLVTPNTRIFTLGKLDSVRVDIVLTDRMLTYIKEDQRSEILSPAIPFGSVSAPISRISPFLHPVAHSTMAEIDLANPDKSLKPGMFVTVDVFYGESEKATLVPLSALWENPVSATVGVFVCRDSLTGEPSVVAGGPHGGALTDPVPFQFIPVDVIAKGRMNAAVSLIKPDEWIVTLGQELLGADTSEARVKPVNWKWVEDLQKLQREDMLNEIMKRQQKEGIDSSLIGSVPKGKEDGV